MIVRIWMLLWREMLAIVVSNCGNYVLNIFFLFAAGDFGFSVRNVFTAISFMWPIGSGLFKWFESVVDCYFICDLSCSN